LGGSYSAEATYINSGHPDFISGHKAMSIISDRMNINKAPQQPALDPKTGRPIPNAAPPSDPQMDLIKQNQQDEGFFGSFFAKKKKSSVMEPVPQVLKATGNLSEREYMEIEVIKLLMLSYFSIVKRTVAVSLYPL
jgi:vacuolar protein sorting-associated protein 1